MTKTTKPKTPAKDDRRLTIDPSDQGKMKEFAGGSHDAFNMVQMGAVVGALYYSPNWSDAQKNDIRLSAATAMKDMVPRDVIDGMLLGQIVVLNNAALDAIRRGQIPEQTFAGRQMNMSAATKLAGAMARMVEIFDRRRGNGSTTQTVRVEHITVETGANAVIGNVEAGARGGAKHGIEGQPHKPAICASPAPVLPAMRGQDATRDKVPVAGDAKRALSPARGIKSGRAARSG